VGIAIFDAIRTGVLNSQLAPRVSAAALAHGFPAASAADPKQLELLVVAAEGVVLGKPAAVAFKDFPDVTPALISATVTAFRGAYAYAFQRVFLSTIPFGVIALVASFFIKDASQYLTNHTAVHLEKEHLRQHEGDEEHHHHHSQH
jgi:hypothetical protein